MICSVGLVWGQRNVPGELSALLAEVHAVVVFIDAQARSRRPMDNWSNASAAFSSYVVT